MRDVYARRIDRFFRSHPQLANAHLADDYFEVRAIAARYADIFHLGALMNDPDETVRLQVALRVPQRLLLTLREDPHREVRIRVAMRLEGRELLAMAGDEDYYVRKLVARRLPEARFHVIGSRLPEELTRLAGERVVVHGHVESLDEFLDGCRLSVAPLRYGAGVKGKVNLSMAHGQPVVATACADRKSRFCGDTRRVGVHGRIGSPAVSKSQGSSTRAGLLPPVR